MDFEAAYDGPVMPGAVPLPVDDLMICENCLQEAFDLIDPQNLHQTIAELTRIVLDQQKEIAAKDKAIIGSRHTINELVDNPVAPVPGRPKLEGVPDEVREALIKARFSRNGTTPGPKTPYSKRKKAEA